MSQYQRMVSYLYEYKQGVKGVNVGYVRIEQRGTGCRISLQMRGRNLGQLSDVSVFRQGVTGIRYYTIGTLTERNGDYRCRIETESENLLGSGITLSDVDGIILYPEDAYYVATTWKNREIRVGESRVWDPGEPEPEIAGPEAGRIKPVPEIAETGAGIKPVPEMMEPESLGAEPGSVKPASGTTGQKPGDMKQAAETAVRTVLEPEGNGQQSMELESAESVGISNGSQEVMGQGKNKGTENCTAPSSGQNSSAVMGQRFPRWGGMPFFRRRPMGNGNIPIPQMAEWSNGNDRMVEPESPDTVKIAEDDGVAADLEQQGGQFSEKRKEQIEEQAVCGNCPFKRKGIDYGKRILMTFPVMRPFPDDQKHTCVRIEPQDLGCLPMQMWTLANNHFLLQGYYCYRHLIFMESENNSYILGVPGIYDRRTCRQAEQFGFPGFRAICGGKQCEGAFGYWIMPLSL